MAKPKKLPELRNDHGMFTYDVPGAAMSRCLGYLLTYEGRVFDPSFGVVDVDAAAAEEHNRLLSLAEVAGLDTARIGEGCMFYPKQIDGKVAVVTWIGQVVSDRPSVSDTARRVISFQRNGKRFSGCSRKGEDCVFFKRTA